MKNNKNKKSVKFQGDMLNYCDFIQVFVFTSYHHLKGSKKIVRYNIVVYDERLSQQYDKGTSISKSTSKCMK